MTSHAPPLWTPQQSRVKNSSINSFIEKIKKSSSGAVSDPLSLYTWSIKEPQKFWSEVWDYCALLGDKGTKVIHNPEDIVAARFFPEGLLNFGENLLRFRGEDPALTFYGEESVRKTISYKELHRQSGSFSSWLLNNGVKAGDVVAGLLPNMPEAVIGMLGAASIGAVWSSCSPDFGASGVVDRFGQIEPKVLIASDGYFYRGQAFNLTEKIRAVINQIPSIERVLLVPYISPNPDLLGLRGAALFSEATSSGKGLEHFSRFPFRHPLYVMFSSGTTGKPKCIVHGAGGTLLEHMKEHILHTDLKKGDVVFYQTTCGWMMWNWLVSGLAVGSHLILYDGYPFQRDGKILWDIAEKEKISIFGTNAKYLSALEKAGVRPAKSHMLSNLQTILSTGSPLLPESFDYVYRDIKSDVCLSSIAGGTDIIGCFALGCPALPVYRSELQMRSLGLKVEVFNDAGASVVGEKGELVCTAPFPSQPIGFWNDPDGSKYRASYFSKFKNVWHHGDYVELTEHGGMIFYGRSDTVLNPGGVRIGTSEIYRQVETLEEITDCVAVGQEWEGDVRIVLFVVLKSGAVLDEHLKEKIKSTIKTGASPFHVPKKILAISDIPRTRSGKIVELAVRETIHGRPIQNSEALLNPEALNYFKDIPDLFLP